MGQRPLVGKAAEANLFAGLKFSFPSSSSSSKDEELLELLEVEREVIWKLQRIDESHSETMPLGHHGVLDVNDAESDGAENVDEDGPPQSEPEDEDDGTAAEDNDEDHSEEGDRNVSPVDTEHEPVLYDIEQDPIYNSNIESDNDNVDSNSDVSY